MAWQFRVAALQSTMQTAAEVAVRSKLVGDATRAPHKVRRSL